MLDAPRPQRSDESPTAVTPRKARRPYGRVSPSFTYCTFATYQPSTPLQRIFVGESPAKV